MAIIFKIALLLFVGFANAQTGLLGGGVGPGRFTLDIGAINGGAFTLVDFSKSCTSLQASGTAFPAYLNNNNYPSQSPPSTQIFCTITIPSSYANDWWVVWRGQAGNGASSGFSVSSGPCAAYAIVSGSQFVASSSCVLNLTGTDGAVRFRPPASSGSMTMTWAASGTSLVNFTDIAICRADQVSGSAACLARAANTTSPQCPGVTFASTIVNPDYACFLYKANPRTLRMLGINGQGGNNNIRSQYRYDTPVTALTYSSTYYPAGAWGGYLCAQTTTGNCSGIGSGNSGTFAGSNQPDASCSTPNCGYADGETYVVFVVDAGAGGSDTINIGGRGAKPLLTASAGANTATTANTIYTFVYDALLGAFMRQSGGLPAQAPVEVQAALCNVVAKDCWFQIPNLYDVTSAGQMATAVQAALNAPNKAIFEYSNEPWLTGTQYQWGCQHGMRQGFPRACNTDGNDWVGYQFRRLFGGVYANWPAGDLSRLKGIMTAFIASSPWSNTLTYQINGANLTFDSDGFYTQGASSQSVTGSISTSTCDGSFINFPGTLSVSSNTGIQVGQLVNGTGVLANTRIMAQRAGGGTNWCVNQAQTVASTTLTMLSNAVASNWSQSPNRPRDFAALLSNSMYYRGANLVFTDTQYIVLQSGKTITAISKANPGVVTSAGHGYSNGDRVKLQSIAGMTELSNSWTTVSSVTTDTFALSSCVNSSGATLSCDTTSYGTFTSGTAARQVPGVNSALLTAADQWASADATQQATALAWVESDTESGLRLNSSGVPTGSCCSTISEFNTLTTQWQTTMGSLNLPTLFYEGAYDPVTMTLTTAAQLGIDAPGCSGASCYSGTAGKINQLIIGYKSSDRLRQSLTLMSNQIAANITCGVPGWSLDIDSSTNVGAVWALVFGNLYTTPYMSYDAFANFNAGLKPAGCLNFLFVRDLDPAANDNSPMWLNKVA